MIRPREQIPFDRLKKILIHKPDHLGDILCAVPAMACLRAAAPQARIIAGAFPAIGAFWQHLGLVDEVHPLPGPAWWRTRLVWKYLSWVRSRNFDLVVNFRHDLRDIFLLRFAQAGHIATYDHRGIGKYAPHPPVSPDESLSEMENHLRLARAMGLNPPSDPYRVKISEEDMRFAASALPGDGPWIALHPFAGSPAKTWPRNNLVETLKGLTALGAKGLLIGGRENREEAEKIAAEAGDCRNLTGQTSPGKLMALIASVRVLVSTDSGPGHVGPLVGTPVVSLMSGVNRPERWAPKGAFVLRRDIPCALAPCGRTRCPVPGRPCMEEITPGEVLRAIGDLLQP